MQEDVGLPTSLTAGPPWLHQCSQQDGSGITDRQDDNHSLE